MLGMEWQSEKSGLLPRGDAKSDGVSLSGGLFQDNSTSGQEESASKDGKHGEKTTNTIDRTDAINRVSPDIASGFL